VGQVITRVLHYFVIVINFLLYAPCRPMRKLMNTFIHLLTRQRHSPAAFTLRRELSIFTEHGCVCFRIVLNALENKKWHVSAWYRDTIPWSSSRHSSCRTDWHKPGRFYGN